MNARDVIAHFRLLGPQDDVVIYTYFATHARDFTLMSGDYLHEPRHWSLFFHELAVECRTISTSIPSTFDGDRYTDSGTRLKAMRPASQRRWDEVCPECGHVHIEDSECGFPQGGGRICRCERRVTA